MTKSFLKGLELDTKEVIKKSFGSSLVKFSGMFLGLLLSVFIGRTLGTEGLGIINLSNRIVNICIIVGLFGFSQVLIKDISIARHNKDVQSIKNIMYSSYLFNGILSTIISLTLILNANWLSNVVFKDPALKWPLVIASIAMVPMIFSRIFAAGLVAYRKVWQSNLVDRTLSVAIISLILGILWLLGVEITLNLTAICYGVSRLFVAITMLIYWSGLFNSKLHPIYIGKEIRRISTPIFWGSLATSFMTNLDLIILARFVDSQQVGIYAVCTRLAFLSSIILNIVGPAISPKLAVLFKNGETKKLEKLMQQTTLGLGLIAVIVLIVLVFGGRFILNIWGKDFVEGYWILVILSIGQFFNIGTGACGLLLMMTGYERIQGNISIIFLLIYLVLAFTLIYFHGAIGLAIGSATTIAGLNITRLYFAQKKIGFKIIKTPKFK